jgi:hypothetical protein
LSLANGPSCSCGGSNANCSRCFGTGVTNGGAASVGVRRERPRLQAVRSTLKERVQCRHCGLLFSAADMPAHTFLRHVMGRPVRRDSTTVAPRVRQTIATRFKKPERKLVHCPACPSRVRADRLDRHLRRVHEVERSVKRRPVAIASIRLIRCANCGANVRPDRVSKHLARVHAHRPENHRKQTSSRTSITSRPKHHVVDGRTPELIQPSTSDEYRAERSLDASRDYYRFRESGRFGSHSMHDDFGDESGS